MLSSLCASATCSEGQSSATFSLPARVPPEISSTTQSPRITSVFATSQVPQWAAQWLMTACCSSVQ